MVPKSTDPKHIADNALIGFELSKEEMERLDLLECGKKLAWNPELVV